MKPLKSLTPAEAGAGHRGPRAGEPPAATDQGPVPEASAEAGAGDRGPGAGEPPAATDQGAVPESPAVVGPIPARDIRRIDGRHTSNYTAALRSDQVFLKWRFKNRGRLQRAPEAGMIAA